MDKEVKKKMDHKVRKNVGKIRKSKESEGRVIMEQKDNEWRLLKLKRLRRYYAAVQACAESIQEISKNNVDDLYTLENIYALLGGTIGDMSKSISDYADVICDALYNELDKLNKQE